MKLLPALAVIAMSGCLATGSGAHPGPTVVMDSIDLEPGAFHEINLRLRAGGGVSWDWSVASGHEVDFNVHRHDGGGVHYEVRGRWASHDGDHGVDEAQGVSLMWSADAHVQVAYRLWGNFTVDGSAG